MRVASLIPMAILVFKTSDDSEWHVFACPLSRRVQFDDGEAIWRARHYVCTRRYFEMKALDDKGQVLAHWQWNAQVREPKLIEGKEP